MRKIQYDQHVLLTNIWLVIIIILYLWTDLVLIPLPWKTSKKSCIFTQHVENHRKGTAKNHQLILPEQTSFFHYFSWHLQQVRVKIIKARHLPGHGINPTVRLRIGEEVKQTKVKTCTNKPQFDETFFFNYNERPNPMLDQMITFEVHNSKVCFRDRPQNSTYL